MSVKVVVNGYGTIGKCVADAVTLQSDMEIAGVAKTRPNFEAQMALEKRYPPYVPAGREPDFEVVGMEVSGTVEDLLKEGDVVVNCMPNKALHDATGIKAMWQSEEDHELAGISFNAHSNYDETFGCDCNTVISCNTTGVSRTISRLGASSDVEKASMPEKPRLSHITPMERLCFLFLCGVFGVSLSIVLLWSIGLSMNGIEYWNSILISSISFAFGFLMGKNS
jgi:glyceraldehyde-3-phosphate dehydrogenase/erythrose-4-phosphate dehydrogenase